MKRITIRRKKKNVQATEPEKPVLMDDETSEYSSSESLAETEPPIQQLRNLKVDDRRQSRPKVRFEPQHDQPRRPTFVEQQSFPVQPRQTNPYPQENRGWAFDTPRSIQYPKPSNRRRGKRNLHYASHFGANGHMLDTQAKTRMFLSTCF